MTPARTTVPVVGEALPEDFSLEMTGKDVHRLQEACDSIPRGTRINITFLAGEDLGMRLAAARAVKRLGFVPVPHISARRLPSRAALEEFLSALAADGTAENVFVVGGGPARPEGPYDDALAVLRTAPCRAARGRNAGLRAATAPQAPARCCRISASACRSAWSILEACRQRRTSTGSTAYVPCGPRTRGSTGGSSRLS
ncbi:hypothetical protein [Streptomyces camelliae]|uniref:hypothetical protein n=1 Tax=Streptomyces camelliae TaxID=3004093 RepID=UPI002FD836B8